MSLILKQEPANTILTPPAGKSTLFINDTGTPTVKNPNGEITYFPTVQGSNTQILFNDNGAINGNSSFVFNKTTSTMSITNLSVTGTLNAGDISVSSIANGSSNIDIVGVGGSVITSVGGVANVLAVTTTGSTINGTLSVSNSVSATTFVGTLTGAATSAGTVTTAAQTNITSVGILTGLTVGNATANTVFGNGTITTTGVITGNGSGLSSIAGGNVSGAVAFATTANAVAGSNVTGAVAFATTANAVAGGNVTGEVAYAAVANSVAGSNVSGAVGLATFATTANSVAGANVTGAVAFATTANSVAGSNVSGAVGLATFATTANAVAGSNVSGAVAFATTANSVAGSNVSGEVAFAAVANSVSGANVTGAVAFATTANSVAGANVSGTVSLATSATTAGTVTTAAQTNITSVGILTGLTVGNATANTVFGNGTIAVTGTGSFGGTVNMNTNIISNLGTPVSDTDAATKAYVDSVAQGLDTKASVVAATTATITLSGTQTIDGIAVTAGQRVLVKNQTAPAENGIYLCAAGAWTRTTDMDTWIEVPGAYVFVETGTAQADTGWVCTSNAGGTIGVTAMTWTQFSGAGSYTAGTGLTLTGTSFSVNVAQSQITSVGTITGGTWDSAIGSSATFANGLSGANLASINGANVTGTVPSATSATTASTVTNPSQDNITSVGTLTALGVSGTVTASAFTANTGVFTGNGSALTALNASSISSGTLAQARLANASLTVNGTPITLGSTGTITATATNALTIGTGLGGTSYNGSAGVTITNTGVTSIVAGTNIGISGGTGAVTVSVTGTVPSATSATTAGTVTTAAQPSITSVGTLANLNVTGDISTLGDISSGNLSASGNINSANLTISNTIDAVNIKVTDLYSKRTSIPITTNTLIDIFPVTQFRSAKYTMRAGNGTDYQALEVLLVHNSINSIITVYGSLSTSSTDLVAFDTDISAGNVNVYATAVGANTNLNLMGTYVPD